MDDQIAINWPIAIAAPIREWLRTRLQIRSPSIDQSTISIVSSGISIVDDILIQGIKDCLGILWIGPSAVWTNLSATSQQTILIGIDSDQSNLGTVSSSSSSSTIAAESTSTGITYLKPPPPHPFQTHLCLTLFLEPYAWYTNKEDTILSFLLSNYGILNETLLVCCQPSDCGIFEHTNYLIHSVPLDTTVIGSNGRKRTNSVNSKKISSSSSSSSADNHNPPHHHYGNYPLSRLLTVSTTVRTNSTSTTPTSKYNLHYDPLTLSPSYPNRTSLSPPLIHRTEDNAVQINESLIDTVLDFTTLLDLLKTIPTTTSTSNSNTDTISGAPNASTVTSSSSFSLLSSSTSSSGGTINTQLLSWKSTVSSSSSSSSSLVSSLSPLQQYTIDQLSTLLNINFYDVLRISPGHFNEIIQRIEALSLAGVDEIITHVSNRTPTLTSTSLSGTAKATQNNNNRFKRPVCIVYAPCNVYQIIYTDVSSKVSGPPNEALTSSSPSPFLQLPSEKYLLYPGRWTSCDNHGTLTVSIPYPLRNTKSSSSPYALATVRLNPWFPTGLPSNTAASSSSSSSSSGLRDLHHPEIFFNRGILNWHYQRAQWRYRPLGYSYPVRPKHPCSTSSGGPGDDELFEQIITLLTDTNSGSYPIPGGNMSLTDILEICDDIWDDGNNPSQSDDDW